MAAVINVTAGSQAILTIGNTEALSLPGAADGFVIPFVQDVTVNASPGIVRYSVLDSSSSKAFTTVNENSISGNMLLDEEAFFGKSGATNTVELNGLFATSTAKTKVFFTVAFEGADSGDYYVKGSGFIGGLAPTASMDAAVWISPIEIIVDGELTTATV
tara:strand:- start:249 stop:728 length:480 start_codon:yes stop_codon:yes gene_type:complete